MHHLQNTVVKNAIPPAAIKDNADFVSKVIDTRSLRYGEFHTILGVTDIAAATFKVMESDDTPSDANTLGGSPTLVKDITTKPGVGDDNGVWVTGIDFANKVRKRYCQLQVKAGNGSSGTYLASTFVGEKDGLSSSLAADRGVDNAEYV